ncbi:tautomerase family protein [Pseudomonas sp. HK3]|jgi:4-oxalocrotonate tautomerase
MPILTFSTVEGALTVAQKKELSCALTETVAKVLGEKLKPNTWVVINEAPEGSFHIGGHCVSAKNIKSMMN